VTGCWLEQRSEENNCLCRSTNKIVVTKSSKIGRTRRVAREEESSMSIVVGNVKDKTPFRRNFFKLSRIILK
jgi:hypothetical protein